MTRFLAVLLLLSSANCSVIGTAVSSPDLTLIVAGEDMMRIPGATVSLVSRHGRLMPVGRTDPLGVAVIKKERLREALLILVCTEVTHCTALLTSEPRFFEYDERLVILASQRLL